VAWPFFFPGFPMEDTFLSRTLPPIKKATSYKYPAQIGEPLIEPASGEAFVKMLWIL
jgi:hypothetical protein